MNFPRPLGIKIRNGIWEAGLLLVLPLAFHRGFAEQFSAPKLFLSKALIITGLAIWAMGRVWHPAARPAQPFLRRALLAFCVAVLASCLTSPVPGFSLLEAEFALCGPAWVLLLVSWNSDESSARRIAVLTSVASTLVAGIALSQRCGVDPVLWGGYQVDWGTMAPRMRLYSTFGNPNFVGGYLIGTIFPLVALAAVSKSLWAKVLGASLTLIVLAAIVETSSRGAWLGLSVGLMAAGLVLLPQNISLKRELREFAGSARARMLGLGFPGGPATLLTLTVAERLVSQFHGRIYLWRFSWPLFWQHPVRGSGWGTYQLFYLELQARFLAAHPEYLGNWTNNRLLHNDLLQVLLEAGILGFAALVWVLLEYAREARRVLRDDAGLWIRLGIAASMGGVTAILVDSIFNYQFAVPPTYILLFTLLAFPALLRQGDMTQVSQSFPMPPLNPGASRWSPVLKMASSLAIITVAGGLLWQQARLLSSLHAYQTAADFEDRDDLARAEVGYRRSMDLNPLNGLAHFGLSRVLCSTARPSEALIEIGLAERSYSDSHQEVLRGNILNQLNRRFEALAAYRNALRLDPTLNSIQAEIDRGMEAK